MHTLSPSSPLRVQLITDGKPGHLNQLKGLLDQLKALTDVEAEWLDVGKTPLTLWSLWKRSQRQPAFELVVGAGHKTHKAVLMLGRNSFSCLLMKPSVPLNWFDACIIPRHDSPPYRSSVLVTDGVLNCVKAKSSQGATSPSFARGLILIGGESRHYTFNAESIVEQVLAIIGTSNHLWTLTDSRRTPSGFIELLVSQIKEHGWQDKIDIHPHQQTPSSWLPEQYQRADDIWVTPDSVSMVYESLTTGSAVGLFDLAPQAGSRIATGISALIENRQVTPFAHWRLTGQLPRPTKSFCEAERAARWLLERVRPSQPDTLR